MAARPKLAANKGGQRCPTITAVLRRRAILSSSRPARSQACSCTSVLAMPARTGCSSARQGWRLRDAGLSNWSSSTALRRRKFWSKLVLAGTTPRARTGRRNQPRSPARHPRIGTRDQARRHERRRPAPAARSSSRTSTACIFIAKIGIEKGRPKKDGSGENYPDKNVTRRVITPDKKEWHPVDQTAAV